MSSSFIGNKSNHTYEAASQTAVDDVLAKVNTNENKDDSPPAAQLAAHGDPSTMNASTFATKDSDHAQSSASTLSSSAHNASVPMSTAGRLQSMTNSLVQNLSGLEVARNVEKQVATTFQQSEGD